MGKHSLKAGMPRIFKDHRSPEAKALRGEYDALGARFPLKDPVERNVAVLAASAWLECKPLLALVLSKRHRKSRKKPIIGRGDPERRLRRDKNSAAGQYLGGIRTLLALTGNGHPDSDPLAELLRQSGG